MTIPELLAEALGHYDARRLREAELPLCELLALDANHADGLHLRGLIAHGLGQYAAAEEWIGKAIAAKDTVALYYSNLGNALQAQGRLEDAVAQYQQALAVDPNHAVACHNLGARCRRNANGMRRPPATSGRLRSTPSGSRPTSTSILCCVSRTGSRMR